MYGNLSLSGRGLRRYGDVWVVLKDQAIAHRATVIESIGFDYVRRVLNADQPAGFRSTWADRYKLVVAKLGRRIPDISAADYDRYLVDEDESGGTLECVEVHIYGGVSRHAIESIRIDVVDEASQLDVQAISALATSANIPFVVDRPVW